MTGQLSDSPVWDIQDCAPVLTREQVDAEIERWGIPWGMKMLARLDRLFETAEQIERWKHVQKNEQNGGSHSTRSTASGG
jgi:hypothetical protein